MLKSYCSSFYGCELWDLWDNGIQVFIKAWRQGQKAVWNLPRTTHCQYLPMLCECLPLEDEMCKRYLSFIHKCFMSDSKLVNFVVKYGLLYGGMHSLSGCNALFCINKYRFPLSDICNSQFKSSIVIL